MAPFLILLIVVVSGVLFFTWRQWYRPWKFLSRSVLDLQEPRRHPPVMASFSNATLEKCLQRLGDTHLLLDRLQREIRDDEHHLQTMLESMIEGVIVVDGAGLVQTANTRASEIFTVTPPTPGRTVMEAFMNFELHALVQKAAQDGPILDHEIELTIPVKRFLRCNAVRLPNSHPGRQAVLIVIHDITQIRNLEDIRKEFVANVSHELKTPLSIIHGYLEMLMDGHIDSPDDRRKILETMSQNSTHLNTIIEDLLELSRLESERLQCHVEKVNARSMGNKLIADFQLPIERRKMRVACTVTPENGTFQADPSLIERVLSNLLDNALKYTPAGGQIQLHFDCRPEVMDFTIEDTGPGIPDKDRPHIFERFYRVDKARSRDQGGTGLGLSICKHIIQKHLGQIHTENVPGKGARFVFSIPQTTPVSDGCRT